MKTIDRLGAVAVLFMNGWFFALPVDTGLPIWLTPIQVFHGVFIHEALLIAYLAFLFVTRGGYLPSTQYRARSVALMIALLGILGVTSAAANLRPVIEVLGAGRYLVLTAFFLASVYWSRRYGTTFAIRNLLLGMVAAGSINLYLSFTMNRGPLLGALPMLLGQNGPGGSLGIGVVLSAWLMVERESRLDILVAVASLIVGTFAASISFSKLAMLMAGAGLIAWWFVALRTLKLRHSRKWSAAILVAIVILVGTHQDLVEQYIEGVNKFIELKFFQVDRTSVLQRAQYFLITDEILRAHPFFGVSYGGFYDAAAATEAYKNRRSAKEDPESGARGETNPHSSFLYYACANGVPGLVVVGILFWMALKIFWRSVVRRGAAGKVLWCCLAFGYMIYALTLPTLFNTSILYVPMAFGLCSERQRVVRMKAVRQATRQYARA